QQAEYAPTLVGHYALASEHYCHFTSPIRRYPDLTIHRLIDLYVKDTFKKPAGVQRVPGEKELAELGSLCSANEQRAEAAERELKLVLVLRLLEKHLGGKFDGVVTGVANVGVFVQLERYLVEGLLRFEHLLDDWWELDSTHGCVVGQRSGYRITVGDRLDVVITRIHIPTRQMELALAEPLAGAQASRPKAAGGAAQITTRRKKHKRGKTTSRARARRAGKKPRTARVRRRPGPRR
ncbi:MAG: RNB domain-containing ribonuclease, partial [Phycisphaerales bacterium]